MKFYFLPVLLLLSFQFFAQSPCKEMVGYYPNWQWYDRAALVNPMTIDYSKYTVLNYSFFAPQTDGSLLSTDTWADENLLLGPMNWQLNEHDFSLSLPYQCEVNDVKLLASLGGWTLSTNFPGIASDPAKRAHFADHCTNLITDFSFDGIDIDWEYPANQTEKENFTLLLSEIRDSLDVLSISTGEEYLVTAAFSASSVSMQNIDWNAVTEILDFINLMSYDFFGTWDPICNHNSPLFAPIQGDPSFNCAAAVTTLTNVHGVDPSKINLGIPFYGRSFKTTSAPDLFAPVQGNSADNITFAADEGTPLYYNIVLNENLFESHWDNNAQVPYLNGINGLQTFVSYDDTLSVALKAQYILDQNLRGAIVWEITGDYIETSPGSGIVASTPLADKVNEVFCIGGGITIQGCTNAIATNYNPLATEDDGSCIVSGCRYPQALNYNPEATIDDLSCVFECDTTCQSDLDHSGEVGVSDLIIFIGDFGTVCPE
ncbi:MAG: glycoside hydrolase family 18 protein [Flavobacteriales bacterium]